MKTDMGLTAAILACALTAGFFAGVETGAYRLNRIRLRRRAETGSRLARLLQWVVRDMEAFVCLTLAGQNAAVYAAAMFCTALLSKHFQTHWGAQFASTLLLAPTLLIVAEVLPKSLFQVMANPLMRWSAPLLYGSYVLLWPVMRALQGVVLFWRRIVHGRAPAHRLTVTSQYLRFFLEEGRQEGVITEQQDAMVRNIMQCGARPLHRAMIPLSNTRMLSREAGDEDARRLILAHLHARFPVYEGDLGNVTGVLLVMDYLCRAEGQDWRELVRDPIRLAAQTPLQEACRLLQREGQTLGIVTNAEGQAVGIVTMGDLLQEMLGSLDAA